MQKVKWGMDGGGSITAVTAKPSRDMDVFEDSYFILGQRVMAFLGFSPFQTRAERFLRTCVVGFSLVYAVIIQLWQLFTLDFNLRSIILVLQIFLPFISVVNVYLTCILDFVTLVFIGLRSMCYSIYIILNVEKVFFWIMQDWLSLKNEMEFKIMQRHKNQVKFFAKIYGISFCFFIIFNILPPIHHVILSTKKIKGSIDPYPAYSCLDNFLRQKYYYYFIVVYQSLTVIIMTAVGIAIYTSYIGFIQFICARFSIAKYKLHRPFINNNSNHYTLAIPDDYSYWMIDIIQHFSRTVQFVALVNKLSENCYLFQMIIIFFFLVLSILCLFQIPKLLKHKDERKNALAFMVFSLATVLPVYISCYLGQIVMNYSTDFCREASLVPFHQMSLKTQKLLLLMLMMNTKRCTLLIGKIFVSSHEFFCDILRSSLSFAMVLRSMQQM